MNHTTDPFQVSREVSKYVIAARLLSNKKTQWSISFEMTFGYNPFHSVFFDLFYILKSNTCPRHLSAFNLLSRRSLILHRSHVYRFMYLDMEYFSMQTRSYIKSLQIITSPSLSCSTSSLNIVCISFTDTEIMKFFTYVQKSFCTS